MDILQSSYYRINKFLLNCLGQWPYQNIFYKRLIRILFFLLTVSIVVPEIFRLIEIWGDLDYVIECASVFGVQISMTAKFSNYVFNGEKMKILMDRIRNDWKFNVMGSRLEILKDYADKGKKLTEIYSVYMYSTLITYLLMPIMPKFLDLVMPLNESRIVTFPLPTKYGDFDHNKHYFPIMLHADCAAIVTITTIIATDTTYVMYVQHACGLFAALGDELERFINVEIDAEFSQINSKQQEEINYRGVVSCVKLHKDAIEFCNVIESSHTILFFIVIGDTIFCMSIAGYQMIVSLENPNEAFRFLSFTIAQVVHIFFISWPGQQLIDHSERINKWAYSTKWYNACDKSKKLLLLMMLRSQEPCKLTAGKLYVMSLPNFSMLMRTSMSYFTMLTSFR